MSDIEMNNDVGKKSGSRLRAGLILLTFMVLLLIAGVGIIASMPDSATDSATDSAATDDRRISAIIGGQEAVEGRYSYAVSLQNSYGHFCGGSLIALDIVLTAAHCKQSGEVFAVIGRHDLTTTDGVSVPVKSGGQKAHPEYSAETTDNDFMLLFLDLSKVNLNPEPALVKLRQAEVPVGQAVTTVGWGVTNTDTFSTSNVLRRVRVFINSNSDCDTKYQTEGETITDNMVCADAPLERDACQMDSGGPLVIRNGASGSNGERDELVGVVSWGIGCALDGFPGVYARVEAQYQWIMDCKTDIQNC